MNLQEYQARAILESQGIRVPPGRVAASPAEAREIAEGLAGAVVVKAQVLVGGRGKAGGVKLAASPAEAAAAAEAILGMHIKGVEVRRVLVGRAAEIARELYLGVVIDRSRHQAVIMASAEGGVDIEEVASTHPERIARVGIDPFLGLMDYQARELAFGIGLEPSLLQEFVSISRGLWRAFSQSDASLVEINPLAITPDGHLAALDAKMVLDDNALFRHPDLAQLRDTTEEDAREREARELGLSYIRLDGDIGCIVNGAGLAMATMDVIKLQGAEPANFLDIGGGAQADRVAAALRIVLSDLEVRVVLFNIFGGITRCDEVARGIVAARQQVEGDVPMVVRLVGTNEEEGRRILAEAGLTAVTSMREAAKQAVRLLPAASPIPSEPAERQGGQR